MKNAMILALAVAACGGLTVAHAQTAVTPTPPPVIYVPSGTADVAKQAANKQLVLDWLHDFWAAGDFDSWPKYMTADFRNHDPREPAVGAQALVDWLRDKMKQHPMKLPRPDNPHMFLMADGDLVFVGGDPSTNGKGYDSSMNFSNIAGNIIRIQNGKIAEWWYVGGIANPTAQAPRPGEPGYVAPKPQ